jgi:putative nonproteinogenic amino acid hydroxylase
MRSKLLKRIRLDPRLAEEEAQSILESKGTDESSEFTYGTWRSYALWNGTGDQNDTRVREYQGAAHRTALALKMPYLDSVLKAVFATECIRWVRAFQVSDGILVPHRNLRESCRSFKRLSFPIRTDFRCLHSENDCVFHLRLGEVWHLDDSQVHSACSLSPFTRILICIDFDLPENSFESAFRDQANILAPTEPFVSRREPVDTRLLEAIYSLGTIINWQNVRDIIQLLIKIHFYRDVDAVAFYDWLIEIAARSQAPKLLQKVTDFKRFCVDARDPYETFEWGPGAGRLHQRIFGP